MPTESGSCFRLTLPGAGFPGPHLFIDARVPGGAGGSLTDSPYNGVFMPVPDVVIVGAARTPIGQYGGAFKDVHPAELGAVAARAALERAGV